MRVAAWLLHMALPMLGLWLLVAKPQLDLSWEHHGGHFGLVAGVAVLNVGLGLSIGAEARRHRDARLLLVALAFLAAAGFLGLHALATPGVVLEGRNAGFTLATPVGLTMAAVLAALSAVEWPDAAAGRIVARQRVASALLLAVMAAWGAWSLLDLAPLRAPLSDDEARRDLGALAAVGVGLYAFAAYRYWMVHRKRPSVMLVSVITAFVLLAEAMVAGVYARNWHASWWEWHVLMAAGFGFVAYSAHVQYRREGTAAGIFDSVSLQQTLQAVRADYAAALEALVEAIERQAASGRPEPLGPLTAALADRFGLTERQAGVLERSAVALAREREQARRLDGMVAAGREASVIRDEHDLLARVMDIVGRSFAPGRLGLALVVDGELRAVAGTCPGPLELPLMVKGHRAGVLYADEPASDTDRPLLESLAGQLSIALENTRLYQQLDGLFRSYLSPQVATALVADPEQARLGGAVRDVTMLMADLRGFTAFSEAAEPADVLAMLNAYFGVTVPVVLAGAGTVLHFVGDALVAVWNAPVRQPDHPLLAVRAALGVQRRVDEVAATRPGWPRFRIGVNSGPALVGNLGSDEVRCFTAIGDTVNVAARLEAAAEEGQVVIGALTHAALGPGARVTPMGPIMVKGRAQPVEAFVLHSLA